MTFEHEFAVKCFLKAGAVILSCKNVAQYKAAERYVELCEPHLKKYEGVENLNEALNGMLKGYYREVEIIN